MSFYTFLVLTLIWFAFMTWLSHQDGEHTGRTSQELAERLSFLNSDTGVLNGRLRKAAHVIVFAVLTFLIGMTLWVRGVEIWWMGLTMILGYFDEATKPLIEGRHFSWKDVRLNLIGVMIGGGVVLVVV